MPTLTQGQQMITLLVTSSPQAFEETKCSPRHSDEGSLQGFAQGFLYSVLHKAMAPIARMLL